MPYTHNIQNTVQEEVEEQPSSQAATFENSASSTRGKSGMDTSHTSHTSTSGLSNILQELMAPSNATLGPASNSQLAHMSAAQGQEAQGGILETCEAGSWAV